MASLGSEQFDVIASQLPFPQYNSLMDTLGIDSSVTFFGYPTATASAPGTVFCKVITIEGSGPSNV